MNFQPPMHFPQPVVLKSFTPEQEAYFSIMAADRRGRLAWVHRHSPMHHMLATRDYKYSYPASIAMRGQS